MPGIAPGADARSWPAANRRVDELVCFAHERLQMCRALEALRVDLVDVLRPRRPRRKPSARGHNLEAANSCVIAWSPGQFRDDALAGERLFLHIIGRELLQ